MERPCDDEIVAVCHARRSQTYGREATLTLQSQEPQPHSLQILPQEIFGEPLT